MLETPDAWRKKNNIFAAVLCHGNGDVLVFQSFTLIQLPVVFLTDGHLCDFHTQRVMKLSVVRDVQPSVANAMNFALLKSSRSLAFKSS